MTEPTVASAVLQDDGRYLVTLNDGATYYGPVGAGAPLTVQVTIPPVTVDPTGLATAAKQDTGNADLADIVTNTTGLAKESGGNLDALATNTIGLAQESGGNLAAIAVNTTPPVASGTEGNLWSATSVLAMGVSAPFHVTRGGSVALFGHADAATRIALTRSQDGVAYYGADIIEIPVGGSDFSGDWSFPVGLWLQLVSESAATITATAAASA